MVMLWWYTLTARLPACVLYECRLIWDALYILHLVNVLLYSINDWFDIGQDQSETANMYQCIL